MSPDYARGHEDGYREAQSERPPTEAEEAAELRAIVAWASLAKSA